MHKQKINLWAPVLLPGSLRRTFFDENKEEYAIIEYSGVDAVLEGYPERPDLILMDIDMPLPNGVEASRRIREFDGDVLLIFITNMIQYAQKVTAR